MCFDQYNILAFKIEVNCDIKKHYINPSIFLVGLNMFGDGPSTVHSRENHSIFSPGNSSILSPQLSFDVDTGASAMDDGSGDAGSLFSQNTPKRSESDPFSMFDSNPKTPNTPGNNFRLDFYSMGEQEEGGGFMLFGNRDNNDDSNSASTGFCFDWQVWPMETPLTVI